MGLTLKDVEHRSGVTYAYISEVELARKNASYSILEALCGALGMDVTEYLRSVAYVMEHPGETGRIERASANGPNMKIDNRI
jgi:transcriptional regulator with XRE-family HTH domain